MPSPPTSGSVTPTNGAAPAAAPRSPPTPSPQRFSRTSRDAPVKVVKDPNPSPRVVKTSIVALHPDFCGAGDVLIVCDEPDGTVGFRVSSRMLCMASPLFVHLLSAGSSLTKGATSYRLEVDDSAHDMHAFLRLLRFGAVRPAPTAAAAGHGSAPAPLTPPTFEPSVAQYAGIHRLVNKYNGWYPRAVLDFHIELNAGAIVDRVGEAAGKDEVFALVRLAHDLCSSYLWTQVCDRLRNQRWWHDILNPWAFGDDDVAALGPTLFSIISILASVSSRQRLFSHLDELCIMYSDEGEVSVAAAERPASTGGYCRCGVAI
ncbi:uncharacterized protein LOC62_07G009292 [Vanrija pseudolonga]|uniref:BTB domain-containing protein n=1 Tax=Vanrija pseudolonga TaxID=143232 RepID=A0AAF0YJJ3_9TREE|nr:hypothetical protein LOC62_07G009292 [Vanrija pseudolonga]